jgi:hypothetical protein
MEIHPALAQMQRDDRAYQEASVAFYQDKPKAVQLFRAIGASQSPHRAAARYNVANLLANGKDVKGARAEAEAILADPSLSSVHAITEELIGYIANVEDTPEGWTALIDHTVAALSLPAKDILAGEKLTRDYARGLYDIDYAGIGRKQDDWWIEGRLPENATISKAVMDAPRKHPMALWMMTGQSMHTPYDSSGWALAGTAWKERMASYIDRAMALQPAGAAITGLPRDTIDALKATSDDASRAALWAKARAAMAAAASSCGEAPETAAVSVLVQHALRVSAEAGKFDEAYAGLSDMPAKDSRLYGLRLVKDMENYLLATGNVEEGRRFRDRFLTPEFIDSFIAAGKAYESDVHLNFMLWVAEDMDHWMAATAKHSQKLAQPLLNMLPAKTLWAMGENPAFSDAQRALLTRAAWTRGYARGITQPDSNTAKLFAANPQLKAAYDKVGTDYPGITAERQRLLTILRNPRFGILVNMPGWGDVIESERADFAEIDAYDHNDKNWWCPLEPDRQTGSIRSRYLADAGLEWAFDYPNSYLKPFLDPAVIKDVTAQRDRLLKQHPLVKTIDWKEVKALAGAASAPRLLSESAIRWGKASDGKDGAAEALALAVRVTRYGCNWHGGHKTYSSAAQKLLREKFADTSWAKATPYWFDCMDNEWDNEGNKTPTCKPKTWPKQPPLR